MAMIVCCSNTVRESSHISSFCGGDPYSKVVQWPEYTYEELTGLLEWSAGLCLQFQITDLIFSLKSQAETWTSSLPHLFSVYGWLSELTYFCFFSVFVDLIRERKYLLLYP